MPENEQSHVEEHDEVQHVIHREDGKAFVCAGLRESFPNSLPRRVKVTKLTEWAQTHETDYLAGYTQGAASRFIFASAQGYALGECARDHFKPQGPMVWVEPVNDNQSLIVVLSGQEVLADALIETDAEDLPFELMPALMGLSEEVGEGASFTLTHHDEPPLCILAFIHEQELNAELDALEDPLLPALRASPNVYLRPFDDALRTLTAEKSKAGIIIKAALVVGVLMAIGVTTSIINVEETVTRIVDRYSTYRNHLERPTASAVLQEIHYITTRAQASEQWVFESCEYSGGRQIACELKARPGARGATLDTLTQIIGRPVEADLVGSAAVAQISMNTQPRQGEYVITNRVSATTAMRDRLVVGTIPDHLSVLPPDGADTWSRQGISIGYQGTGPHKLIQMSAAAKGFPVHLVSLQITRNSGVYDIEAVVSVFGSR